MIAYQQRVVDELHELVTRRTKLLEFIKNNSAWRLLPDDEQIRMTHQCDVMGEYEDVLQDRIAHFKLVESVKLGEFSP
jgi:hypothetical protein